MTVGVYPVTDQEHRRRGKKRKESSKGQQKRNKQASLRRKHRKVLANFNANGFFLTGTFDAPFLPLDMSGCAQEVRNYKRRVERATCKRFGVQKEQIKLMLFPVRKGEAGRLHFHGFAQCDALDAAQRREWREMLEDLWRRGIPGTREFEPMGTINVDRINMKKLLGMDGQGPMGTVGYIYGHKEMVCIETRNLILPEVQRPNDSRWSRRQLRKGCLECADNAYWWEQRYPGWECCKVLVFDPGGLHEGEDAPEDSWVATEPQAYIILRRRFAKVRT